MLRFSLVLLPLWLQAQSPRDSILLDGLRPVTVTATRLNTPAQASALAVSALTGAYIREGQPQLTLQESLGAVPGVFVLNDANFAQDLRIAVRGFGARAAFGIRGIKLLLDGIPESAPDGQAQVDNLDMGMVSRLEVVRGASGGLYGNASGGVISLSTDPLPEKAFGAVRLAGGSFGFRQLQAQGGTRFRHAGFRVGFTHIGIDGFRAHAAFRNTLLHGKWAWIPDSTVCLTVLLNGADSPRADDPGALTRAQVQADARAAHPSNIRFDAGESVRQGRVGVLLDKRWPRRRQLRLRAYSTWRDFENRLPLQSGGQVAFQRQVAGGGAQYTQESSRWRFGAGLDLDRQADERQRYDNLEGHRGDKNLDQLEVFGSAGAYLQGEWKAFPQWTFSGGARGDRVLLRVDDRFAADGLQSGKSAYQRASPWAGLVWRLHARWQAYANLTTNFETPTLNELSNNPVGTGGFNPTLRPQRAVSLEAGMRSQWPADLVWELAAFRVAVQDELVPYELNNLPGRVFYRNAGQTLRQGLEVSAAWYPASGWQLRLTYTLAHFDYIRFATPAGDWAGKQLPGLPQHWGAVEVRYAHRSGWYAGGQARYTGRYYADDGNSERIAPNILVSLRFGQRFRFGPDQFFCFAGIDNATGRAYFNNIRINAVGGRFFEPGTGASFFAGIAWQWE